MLTYKELMSLPLDENPEIFERREWLEADIETAARDFAETHLTHRELHVLGSVGNQLLNDSFLDYLGFNPELPVDYEISTDEIYYVIEKFTLWMNIYLSYGRDE